MCKQRISIIPMTSSVPPTLPRHPQHPLFPLNVLLIFLMADSVQLVLRVRKWVQLTSPCVGDHSCSYSMSTDSISQPPTPILWSMPSFHPLFWDVPQALGWVVRRVGKMSHLGPDTQSSFILHTLTNQELLLWLLISWTEACLVKVVGLIKIHQFPTFILCHPSPS